MLSPVFTHTILVLLVLGAVFWAFDYWFPWQPESARFRLFLRGLFCFAFLFIILAALFGWWHL